MPKTRLPASSYTTSDRLSEETSRRAFQQQLLNWFEAHQRDLPWRNVANPYETWVSEIMLQQTQVATVIPYFRRWMTAFPSIAALASATEEEVLNHWEGLGYYRRARFLHETAKYVVEHLDGNLPSNATDLRKLKGIGPYTAGAIASIAFGEHVSAVDGNVIRVVSRLLAVENVQPKRSTAATLIAKKVTPLISATRPGDFNQALMELGSTTCKPTSPACLQCPVKEHCEAFLTNRVENFPLTGEKCAVRQATAIAAIVYRRRDDVFEFLVEQRPEKKLLGGTWQFPMEDDITGISDYLTATAARGIELAIPAEGNLHLGTVSHKFSHIDMKIEVRVFRLIRLSGDADWVTLEEFGRRPVSTALRKVEKVVTSSTLILKAQ